MSAIRQHYYSRIDLDAATRRVLEAIDREFDRFDKALAKLDEEVRALATGGRQARKVYERTFPHDPEFEAELEAALSAPR